MAGWRDRAHNMPYQHMWHNNNCSRNKKHKTCLFSNKYSMYFEWSPIILSCISYVSLIWSASQFLPNKYWRYFMCLISAYIRPNSRCYLFIFSFIAFNNDERHAKYLSINHPTHIQSYIIVCCLVFVIN